MENKALKRRLSSIRDLATLPMVATNELRTPLSTIKSYSEALLTKVQPADHETREQFLSVIDSEKDRLSDIVAKLLDLSRIESGKFELNYTCVNIEQLINSVLSTFKTKADNIDIYTDFDKDLPLLEIVEEKIREVMINLIANAIKFSPMGGTLSVSIEKQDNLISLSVSDTGFGVPETIRTSEKSVSDIPFIMLTAKAQKDDVIKGMITGANDYIVKPYKFTQLLIKLKSLIGGQ